MARQLRIEFPGAFYHVMARGDRREPIFADDDDRRRFLSTLAEACESTGWVIHAYVLMGNHYHLLIETPEPNLVRGMTWLQGTYTIRYNARHRVSGHLFGGRYKAVLVQAGKGDYYRCLLDYIHLNPVRAGIATLEDGLDAYPWSSLREYRLLPAKRKKWLGAGFGLQACGLKDTAAGRRRFLVELERRAKSEPPKKAGLVSIEGQSLQSTLRRGWYFGEQAFRELLLGKSKQNAGTRSKSSNYHGAEIKAHDENRAELIIKSGLKQFDLRASDLPSLPKSDDRKALIALAVKSETTVALNWLSERLSMGVASGVSRYTSDIRRRAATNRKLNKTLEAIRQLQE